jgi:arylsulfatase A-like enzyme
MPDPPVGDWADEVLKPYEDGWRADPSVAALPPRALRRARAGYYGHMSHIDLQINRFVEALSDYGLLHDTVIMFTSDHGELLGDHNAFRKCLPYEGSARIPMILAGPGVPSRAVDSRIVELRDVMPTLLRLAAVDPPEGIDGIDALCPTAKREMLHGEHTYAGQSVHYLVDGKMKYVWWSGTGREQLFDLESDPFERFDLGNTPQAARYRERLIAELDWRPEGFVQNGELVAGRPVSALLP